MSGPRYYTWVDVTGTLVDGKVSMIWSTRLWRLNNCVTIIKLFLQSGTNYLAKAEMQWLNSRRSRFRFRQVSRAVNARFGPHPAQATHEYSPRLDALPERQPLGHGTTAQNRRDQLCRTRYTCEVGFTVPRNARPTGRRAYSETSSHQVLLRCLSTSASSKAPPL